MHFIYDEMIPLHMHVQIPYQSYREGLSNAYTAEFGIYGWAVHKVSTD